VISGALSPAACPNAIELFTEMLQVNRFGFKGWGLMLNIYSRCDVLLDLITVEHCVVDAIIVAVGSLTLRMHFYVHEMNKEHEHDDDGKGQSSG